MSRAKGKAVRPVKAWAIARGNRLLPEWTRLSREELLFAWDGLLVGPPYRLVEVEVRPVAPKRKPRKKKGTP
jgi:hypothetical protein